MRDFAADIANREITARDAAVAPTIGASLGDQLYQTWPNICFGIVLAGGCYPVVVAIVSLVFDVLMTRGGPDIRELVATMVFMMSAIVVGFFLAGGVSALVLPAVYFVLLSMNARGSIVWLGAFCGGLVGFLSVMAILMGIPLFEGGQSFWELTSTLALGPGLATVMGQLGGAWGGRRAEWNRGRYDKAVALATVGETVATPPAAPRVQFGIRHLLWIAVWLSALLSLVRLSGLPFAFALPLLGGWMAYQAATLWLGGLTMPRVAAWWAAGRRQVQDAQNPTVGL